MPGSQDLRFTPIVRKTAAECGGAFGYNEERHEYVLSPADFEYASQVANSPEQYHFVSALKLSNDGYPMRESDLAQQKFLETIEMIETLVLEAHMAARARIDCNPDARSLLNELEGYLTKFMEFRAVFDASYPA